MNLKIDLKKDNESVRLFLVLSVSLLYCFDLELAKKLLINIINNMLKLSFGFDIVLLSFLYVFIFNGKNYGTYI